MHGEDQSPVCVWMSDRVPPAIANTELEAALARARGRGGVAAQRRLKAIHLTILRRCTVQLQAVIGGGAESRSLRGRLQSIQDRIVFLEEGNYPERFAPVIPPLTVDSDSDCSLLEVEGSDEEAANQPATSSAAPEIPPWRIQELSIAPEEVPPWRRPQSPVPLPPPPVPSPPVPSPHVPPPPPPPRPTVKRRPRPPSPETDPAPVTAPVVGLSAKSRPVPSLSVQIIPATKHKPSGPAPPVPSFFPPVRTTISGLTECISSQWKKVVSLDFHNVVDIDFSAARSVIQYLRDSGIYVFVLSYAVRDSTCRGALDALRANDIGVAVVFTSKPVGELGKGEALVEFWAELIRQGKELEALYHIDDKFAIVQEICNLDHPVITAYRFNPRRDNLERFVRDLLA